METKMDTTDFGKAVSTVGDIFKEVYPDLLQPGVRQAGQAIGTLLGALNVLLIPVKRWNEERWILFEAHMEEFRRKVQSIPEDRICEVCPEIGMATLERLTYVRDPDLSELFLNLLTSASNQDTVNLAHPSFVRIIDCLSPDEAQMLLHFRKRDSVYGVGWRVVLNATGKREEFGSPYGQLAHGLRFPQNMEVYIPNLEGLGILKPFAVRDFAMAEFKEARQETEAQVGLAAGKEGYVLEEQQALVTEVTGYGRMFIQACTKET